MTSGGRMAAHEKRPPFVLVHGAFHGGWCWRPIARLLRQAGHEVFTPTQTGAGERRHLLSAALTMETFVEDVLNVLTFEELFEVILVGHSFGGRTIAGVADRAPDRIKRLVFVDAGLAVDGRSRLETMPADQREQRIQSARDFDGGVSVPPPPPSWFGVRDPDQAAWVGRLLTPHPLGPENSRLRLESALGNGLPATYIHCVAPELPSTAESAEYAKARDDWRFIEFSASHSAIITHAEDMASLLMSEACK